MMSSRRVTPGTPQRQQQRSRPQSSSSRSYKGSPMSGAMVVQHKAVTKELALVTTELRDTELLFQDREAALRRAQEELQLTRELKIVNQMTAHKLARQQRGEMASGLKISGDMLQEILTMEDEIKLESRKTYDLQDSIAHKNDAIQRINTDIDLEGVLIQEIKEKTGYSGEGSYRYVNRNNLFKEQQRTLAELEKEQNLSKSTNANLTRRIEELTGEVNTLARLEEEIKSAEAMLEQKLGEKTRLQDEMKTLKRIALRKEKILDKPMPEDPLAKVKQLEGDKKVLYAQLAKASESKGSAERSFFHQEDHNLRLEGRIEAITGYLRSIFAMEEDRVEHLPQPHLIFDGDRISLDLFNQMQVAVSEARALNTRYDEQIAKLDAHTEINEKKINVLQYSIASALKNGVKGEDEAKKDRANYIDQGESMREEFDREYEKLLEENNRLRKLLGVRERKTTN